MTYSLYIHIPFCKQRCNYCDFYSNTARNVPDSYVDSIINAFQRLAPKNEKPSTVYFGGGTPALLESRQLEKMLRAFSPAADAEITIEANPESMGCSKLSEFRQAGVNRLSVGVQSAKRESLALLGRRHSPEQAARALEDAKKAGFVNVSADIMLALPNYSKQEFDDTFNLIQNGGASHISAYLLKIEEDTAFGRNVPPAVPDDDEGAMFYLYCVDELEKAGYAQYEISNFARRGFESRHNMAYWLCGDYLGIGPAAHSCMNGRRFFFEKDLSAFEKGGGGPIADGGCGGEDYLMLSLRLNRGLNEALWKSRYAMEFNDKQRKFIAKLVENGLARFTENGFALTPRGFLLQNSILAQLL